MKHRRAYSAAKQIYVHRQTFLSRGFIAGFLLLEDFVNLDECERLKQRAEELVADFDPKDISIFSTKNQVSEMEERL